MFGDFTLWISRLYESSYENLREEQLVHRQDLKSVYLKQQFLRIRRSEVESEFLFYLNGLQQVYLTQNHEKIFAHDQKKLKMKKHDIQHYYRLHQQRIASELLQKQFYGFPIHI